MPLEQLPLEFSTFPALDDKKAFERMIRTVEITDTISEDEYGYLCQLVWHMYAEGAYVKGAFKTYEEIGGKRPKESTDILNAKGHAGMNIYLASQVLLQPGTYHLIEWPYADWKSGTFHDSNNCFMSSRANFVPMMFHAGASSFLVFEDKKPKRGIVYPIFPDKAPMSRAWVLPIRDEKSGVEGRMLTNVYSDSGRNTLMTWQLFYHLHPDKFGIVVRLKGNLKMNTEMANLMYWNQSFFACLMDAELGTRTPDLEWDYSKKRKPYHDVWKCTSCGKDTPYQQTLLASDTMKRECKKCASPCSYCNTPLRTEKPPYEIPKAMLLYQQTHTVCWKCFGKSFFVCAACGQLASKRDQKDDIWTPSDKRYCDACRRICVSCLREIPVTEAKLASQHHLRRFATDSMVYNMVTMGTERVKKFWADKRYTRENKVQALANGKGRDSHPTATRGWNDTYYMSRYGRAHYQVDTPCLCKECTKGDIKLPSALPIEVLDTEYRHFKEYLNVKKEEKKKLKRGRNVPVREEPEPQPAPEPVVADGGEAIAFRIELRPIDPHVFAPAIDPDGPF